MINQQNALQVPLLGSLTTQQFKDAVYKSIVDEATAAEFYSRLLQEAPNQLHYAFIEHARQDELEHLSFFEKLYYQYFRTQPQYQIEPVQYPGYKDGLLMALQSELEAVEFYRNMQLSVKDQIARDTYYLAMVDELEHATQFSTLFNQI